MYGDHGLQEKKREKKGKKKEESPESKTVSRQNDSEDTVL